MSGGGGRCGVVWMCFFQCNGCGFEFLPNIKYSTFKWRNEVV